MFRNILDEVVVDVVDDILILSYYTVDTKYDEEYFTKDYDCSIIILLIQFMIKLNIYINI